MSRQICRDFQRGNCRFGTRCKFLHQTGSSQQRSQQNAFDSGPKQSQQHGSGTNRSGTLNSGSNNQRTPQQPAAPARDHKCNNPKVCQDVIKDDVNTEQPTYWRLTSYAHWKFLPNDITGDISPEELRALAYDSAKQGLPIQQIIQKEQSLVAAKITQFESLRRNPYRSPAPSSSGGFLQGQTQPSPFTSGPSPVPFSGFGTPPSQSVAPTGGFCQPATIFGVPTSSTPQSGGGFSNAFNKTSTNPKLSPSPFQSGGFGQSSQFSQIGFGSQVPKNIFGSQPQLPLGNAAGFGAQPSAQPPSTANAFGFGSSPFTTSGFGSSPFTTSGFGSSPFTTSSAFGASPFATPAAAPAATPQPHSAAAATPQIVSPAVISPAAFNSLPPGSIPAQAVQTTAGDEGIWQKETWKLGEIPEEEPPQNVRY